MNTLMSHTERHSIRFRKDLAGTKVLLRIDVNTTLKDGQVPDPNNDWRIQKSFQTIDFLTHKGASVILVSHIGKDPSESLKPVYDAMAAQMNMGFLPNYDPELLKNSIENMQNGSVLMLENLRQHPGEEANDSSFLDPLVELCDLYVNDAFSVSHRNHASVSDITKRLPSYFGLQFEEEVEQLSKMIETSKGKGSVLALGGAKFGTKLELLEKFLPQIEYALIGGALANVFLRERGFEIGKSFADTTDIQSMVNNEKIILPIDIIDQDGDVAAIDEVGPDDIILDIGPDTERLFETIIDGATSILWNGPMGKYEDGFISGSVALADSIAFAKAFSVTGGGDTAAVISQQGLESNFDFISTGGGAMLEFLVEGTLPGIDAIIHQKTSHEKK